MQIKKVTGSGPTGPKTEESIELQIKNHIPKPRTSERIQERGASGPSVECSAKNAATATAMANTSLKRRSIESCVATTHATAAMAAIIAVRLLAASNT